MLAFDFSKIGSMYVLLSFKCSLKSHCLSWPRYSVAFFKGIAYLFCDFYVEHCIAY